MDPSPGPATPSLRPMRVGEIMDGAIKLYRHHWKAVLTIAAVIIVPVAALQTILFRDVPMTPQDIESMNPEELGRLFGSFAVAIGVQLLTTPLLTGGLSWLAAKYYLGENPTPQQALGVAFSKFLPLIWVSILTFLATFLSLLIVLVPVIIAVTFAPSDAIAILLGIVGFLVFIAAIILFALRLTLSATALVVEGVNGTAALKRSWALSKGNTGKIFLTLLVSYLLTAIFQLIVGVPFSLIGTALEGPAGNLFIFVGDAITGTITTPFLMIVLVLLYFDIRIRKEAFDLTLMAQEIGPTQ